MADEALPSAADGNAAWLTNRRAFGDTGRPGRQYVAAEPDGRIVGYGAIEEDAEFGRYRLFVVMSAERLDGGVGALLYERLYGNLVELGAHAVWMREQSDDRLVLAFATARGFRETQRFIFDGVEMVVLELVLPEPPPTPNFQHPTSSNL